MSTLTHNPITMFITITYIKLRSPWKFFQLTYNGYRIQQQLKGEKGFVKMKNTGFGLMHYTISLWESEEDRTRFYRSGNHADAMKKSAELSSEIGTLNYSGTNFPSWKEAKKRVHAEGKVIRFKD
ncbi:MAG: DUF3291 domain-containing protein [Bacteroidota bacterium]|nr:DUF3291 domain-containing protein [Bacteroidota bacterium]MDX5430863.1 DUF3291 domain-containing protein [Bacteroidota bacterium]MDX5469607.1 DUF3291 domain-containing protein [Bacteroidota bacterium]